MLSKKQQIIKRVFDIILSVIGLFVFLIPMFILTIIASVSTKSFGVFSQKRVGKDAVLFYLYKI